MSYCEKKYGMFNKLMTRLTNIMQLERLIFSTFDCCISCVVRGSRGYSYHVREPDE